MAAHFCEKHHMFMVSTGNCYECNLYRDRKAADGLQLAEAQILYHNANSCLAPCDCELCELARKVKGE